MALLPDFISVKFVSSDVDVRESKDASINELATLVSARCLKSSVSDKTPAIPDPTLEEKALLFATASVAAPIKRVSLSRIFSNALYTSGVPTPNFLISWSVLSVSVPLMAGLLIPTKLDSICFCC